MIKIKSTENPSNRISEPYSKPNMAYVFAFWSKKGCNFNYELYLKILEIKSKML